jgi:predicted nuclease of predicted toxin-antitoxin system
LSPLVAEGLRSAGFDVVHVRDWGMRDASDASILERARNERRIVVSRDGDFAALLTHLDSSGPSFIHLREPRMNRPHEQVDVIKQALKIAGQDLSEGAIVSIRGGRMRVRRLPIH